MRIVDDWGGLGGHIEYPNAVAYCNMPMLVRVTDAEEYVGAAVTLVVNGEYYTETRELRNGECVFDIARYAQMAFVGKSVEYGDQQTHARIAPTSQEVEIVVRMTKGSGASEDAVRDYICVVLGRLGIGQSSGRSRTRMWWVNLPQSFDIIANPNTDVYLTQDGETQSLSLETPDRNAQVFVDLSKHAGLASDNIRKARLFASHASIVQGGEVIVGDCEYNLLVDRCTSGVYLRWLDNLGQWCYYLFRVTGRNYNASVEQEWLDGIVRDELVPANGLYQASGQHHQQMSEEQTISLGAKLVNAETFDYLLSLTSASLVDVMVNKEEYVADDTDTLAPQWERVQLVGGSYARTAAPLQDFQVTIKRKAQKGQML